jgi:hypothetical protein
LLLLGLWIKGDDSSAEKIERICVAAAASLFASTGIHAATLPASAAIIPMLGTAVLIAALIPTRKGVIALAAFVVGGWAACWLIKPGAASWPTVGLSLAGLLTLAAALGQTVRSGMPCKWPS